MQTTIYNYVLWSNEKCLPHLYKTRLYTSNTYYPKPKITDDLALKIDKVLCSCTDLEQHIYKYFYLKNCDFTKTAMRFGLSVDEVIAIIHFIDNEVQKIWQQ